MGKDPGVANLASQSASDVFQTSKNLVITRCEVKDQQTDIKYTKEAFGGKKIPHPTGVHLNCPFLSTSWWLITLFSMI